MKKLIAIAAFVCTILTAQAQTLPITQLKNLDGKWVSSETITNDGKPMIISFWATWCKPCLRELHAYQEYYAEWQEELGVKLVAISIDDTRNSAKVGPMAIGEEWPYEVYIDENQDLKRNLGVVNVPHTLVLDGKGNIVWQHAGYNPGDEDHLIEVLRKVAAGEPLEE